MKELKAFIYCRVLDNQARNLLDYQEDELRDLSQYLNMKVIASAKEISGGKYFGTFAMQKLIHYIITEKIDVVLVYDETRLAIYDDLYAEFKMICDKHDVDIVTIDDLKSMIFANSILTSHD